MADALSWLQQMLGGGGDAQASGDALGQLQNRLASEDQVQTPPQTARQWALETLRAPTDLTTLRDLSTALGMPSALEQSAAATAANPWQPGMTAGQVMAGRPDDPLAGSFGVGAIRNVRGGPALIIPQEGLDYRGINMAARPDVPQFPLERPPLPARGLSARWTALDNPETWARYQEGAARGLPQEGSGGREWYNTLPLRRAFTDINPDTGAQDFRRYIDYVGASSPENRVPSNARTASYLYFADKQGLDLPTLYPGAKSSTSIYPADVKALLFPKDAAGIELPSGLTRAEAAAIKAQYGLPTGYGGKAQTDWIQHALNIREGSGFDLMTNPKPPSFTQNLLGNYTPLTVDRHNMRLVAPGLGDAPPRNAYGYLEQLQNRYARDLGLDPAQAQAATWLGGDTGVKSSLSLPFVGEFEQQLNRAAQNARISPREMLRDFVLGNRPL